MIVTMDYVGVAIFSFEKLKNIDKKLEFEHFEEIKQEIDDVCINNKVFYICTDKIEAIVKTDQLNKILLPV
jgi:hypothetical protein